MDIGRELDELVGTVVMGLNLPHQSNARYYSTDIDEAWAVVEKILEDHNYKIVLEAKLQNGWYVYIKNDMGGNVTGLYEFKSAPEAICKISLIALLGE